MTAIKWRKATTFSYRRCTVSYADVDGVRIMCMKHEMRGAPTEVWVHDFYTYRPTAKGVSMECSTELQIPAMVEAVKKTFKAS